MSITQAECWNKGDAAHHENPRHCDLEDGTEALASPRTIPSGKPIAQSPRLLTLRRGARMLKNGNENGSRGAYLQVDEDEAVTRGLALTFNWENMASTPS